MLRDAYMVRLFDASGKKVGEFKTGSKAHDVAISADGRHVAVLRDGYEVKVFDAKGQQVGKVRPGSKAQSVALAGRP